MKKSILYLVFLIPFLAQGQVKGRLNLTNIERQTASGTITIQYVGLPTFYGKNGTATPSQSVNYAFSGSSIGTSGAIASATGVQYSINGGSTWVSSLSGLSAGSGTLLIRGAAATANGTYGPENVTFSATGAVSKNCSITLIVSSANPGIVLTPSHIGLPSTVTGTQGASSSYTVVGTNLTQPTYTVTAPANTVISPDNLTWGTSYTIANQGGGINTNTFVALSPSASPGSYSGYVTYTASDISGVQDTVSGTVTSSGGVVDTVVDQVVFLATSASYSGYDPIVGNPRVAVLTVIGTQNYQPDTVTSVATSKWYGVGSGYPASFATYGVTNTATFAGTGIQVWLNSINGSTTGGVWSGWVPGSENLYIKGLNPSKLYTFNIFCALGTAYVACSGGGTTELYCTDSTNFRVDSSIVSIKGNATTNIVFKNKVPDANGIVRLAVMPCYNGTNVNCGQYGVINTMNIVKQATREGFDDPSGMFMMIGLLTGLCRKRKRYIS